MHDGEEANQADEQQFGHTRWTFCADNIALNTFRAKASHGTIRNPTRTHLNPDDPHHQPYARTVTMAKHPCHFHPSLVVHHLFHSILNRSRLHFLPG